jgi:hypothetical protein
VRGPSPEQQGKEVIAKVVGVTFEGRQEVVARLHLGEQIFLRREPSNRYDPNAICVERLNREQIGYLNRYLAAAIAHCLDAHGVPIEGTVINLTGSSFGGYSLGVNISFILPDVSVEEVEERMNKPR